MYQDPVAVAVSYGRQLLAHIVIDDVHMYVLEQSISLLEPPSPQRIKTWVGIKLVPTANTTNFSRSSRSSFCESEQAPEEASGRREEFIDWLTPINFEARQTHLTRTEHLGVGQWLLNSNEYQSWVIGSGQTLFLPGAPGSGKTLLASTVVGDLKSRFWADRNVGIAYFYLDSQCREEQKNPGGLLLSLVKQLLQRKRTLPYAIEDHLFSRSTSWGQPHWLEPDWLDILELLRLTVREFSRVFVVVDALEDCIASCRKAFLRELRKLQARYEVNIFTTSRYAADLIGQFHDAVQLDILATDEDLRTFVAENMLRLPSFVPASDDLQAEILSKVVSLANRRSVISLRP